MTQRNTQPQAQRITSNDVSAALWNTLPLAAALVLVLVLVLITVQPGAGIGFRS